MLAVIKISIFLVYLKNFIKLKFYSYVVSSVMMLDRNMVFFLLLQHLPLP